MKILFISIGVTSLILGVVGVFLPIIPTTPFLILTSYSFSKGSTKYHNWFRGTNIYKKHLEKFIETKEMTRKQKWTLMIFTDCMLLVSYLMVDPMALKVLIISLILIKHYYFYRYIKVV